MMRSLMITALCASIAGTSTTLAQDDVRDRVLAPPVLGSGTDSSGELSEDEAPEEAPEETPEGDEGSGFSRAFGQIGDLLRRSNQTSEAREEESDDENNVKLSILRRDAEGNFQKGRYTESLRYLNDLTALRPFDPYYHFAQGLCYRRLGQYNEALRKYQDVLDLGGPKPLISVLKAEVYASEGNRDQTFEMLREAALGGRNIINDVQHLDLLTAFSKDTDFIQLALQLERIEIQKTHADPFTNPFQEVDAEVVDTGVKIKEPTPAEQAELVKDAKRVFNQIQLYIKLQEEQQAMTAYMRLKELIAQQKYLTIPKYAKDFEVLNSKLAGIEEEIRGIRLRYYYNQAIGKLERMEAHFGNGEYARVRALDDEIRRLREDMVKAHGKFEPIANRLRDMSKAWVERAEVRLEFETRKPKIQGIVISDDANLAILNDRVVRQGESIADLRVVRVESNRVTFGYKGEEIPLVFRRY